MAAMAGAVAVARAVDDEQLSDAILAAARKLIAAAVSADVRKTSAKTKKIARPRRQRALSGAAHRTRS
jgi:hypothetical protein